MKTIHETILNGPNRFARILGHGTIDGLEVRLRMRVPGFNKAVIEYTDATRESDSWHQLGGSYPLAMDFARMLLLMPCVAQFRMTPALAESNTDLCESRWYQSQESQPERARS